MTWISHYNRRDAPALTQVMYRSVREGATLYSEAERRAWIPKPPPEARLARRLAGQTVRVARQASGPVGFVAIRRDGYVDLAYLLPCARGKGVFRALITCATAEVPGPLRTHASLHAQPAFAAMGFDIIHHEIVRQRGQRLRRALMKRILVRAADQE